MPPPVSALRSLSFIAIICYTWTEGPSVEFQRGYHLDDHHETGAHLLSNQRGSRRKPMIYAKTSTCSKISSHSSPISATGRQTNQSGSTATGNRNNPFRGLFVFKLFPLLFHFSFFHICFLGLGTTVA